MSYLNLIKKHAGKSWHWYYRHVAVVEKGGAVVAVGFNVRGGTHAEVHALKKLWPSKRRGCRVWSLKLSNTGRLTMAKPCPACEAYLREQGIKTVLYSDSEGQIQRLRLR